MGHRSIVSAMNHESSPTPASSQSINNHKVFFFCPPSTVRLYMHLSTCIVSIIMVSFWSSSAVLQTTKKLEKLRQAENQLISFAHRYKYGIHNQDCSIRPFDTIIPRSSIPSLKPCKSEGDELTIHGIHVQEEENENNNNNNNNNKRKSEYPLVALHGYYNGAAYFYRNLVGLASYYESVYSLDWLGWGLSSRPDFGNLRSKHSVESVEEWFVESLEAWRKENEIEKMVLLGHSMGGYMSVAYCERYPQRVHKLLLLSPVGVPDETDPSFLERKERFTSSFRSRMFLGVFRTLFQWTTVGSFLRTYVSEERAFGMVRNYVQGRLPQIETKDEQEAVTDYLYHNAVASGSGEYAVHAILDNRILAKKPLVDRIPKLQVPAVTFFYGQHDWMDTSAALSTQRNAEKKSSHESTSSSSSSSTPKIQVYIVPKAGHLLMLENWKATTAALIQGGGGGQAMDPDIRPVLVEPGPDPMPDSHVRRAAMQRHYHAQIQRQVYEVAVEA